MDNQHRKKARHSPEFKAKVAREAIRKEIPAVEIARGYGVSPATVKRWKRALPETTHQSFEAKAKLLFYGQLWL